MAEDITITAVGDTWVHLTAARSAKGSNRWVQTKANERAGLLKPDLPALAGQTVLAAIIRGHVESSPAATYNLDPITQRFKPGERTADVTRNTAARMTATVGALGDGGVVEWSGPDVLAWAVALASGSDYHGLRLSSSSASVTSFYATDSGEPAWEFYFLLSEETDQADNLRPDGGAVSADRPNLAWDVEDQVAFQVALFASEEAAVPSWTSPWVTSPDGVYALPAAAPAGGAWWEVTVRYTDGEEVVSDRASYTVVAFPALIIDSPTGPFGDPSPRILAHPATGALAWWSIMVTGPSRADVRYESGVQTGPIDLTLPEKNRGGRRLFVTDQPGWIGVTWRDTATRTVAVGDPPQRTVWIPAELASGGATPVTSLSVTQIATGDPRQVWSWQRTEAADVYLLCVDGKWVRRVTADEVSASEGWYSFRDSGEVQPLRPHTYTVIAIDDGVASAPSASVHRRHVVEGFWILDPTGDAEPLVLEGTAVDGIGREDAMATYTTVEGEQTDVIYGRPGYVGEFAGSVANTHDRSEDGVWAALDEVDALVDALDRTRRLVWGSRTMTARLRSPSWSPANEILPNTLLHNVRFGLVQTGD